MEELMKIVKQQEMVLYWERQDSGGLKLSLIGGDNENIFPLAEAPFLVNTMYEEDSFPALSGNLYQDNKYIQAVSSVSKDEHWVESYERKGLQIKTDFSLDKGTSCIRLKTSAKNISKGNIVLTGLSSGKLPCFSFVGEADPRRFEIYYCKQSWCGEGNWICESLNSVGVECVGCDMPPVSYFSISSIGSRTTENYFPLVVVRDTVTNRSFFFEIEPYGDWCIKVGFHRCWKEKVGCIVVSGGCAEEKMSHFEHTLFPGESYEAASCIFGSVSGGIDKVARELTKIRRNYRKRLSEEPMVFFNDYMNCLWANPTYNDCYSLACTAKDLGADWYVMDAGWFMDLGQKWGDKLGDWETDSNRFGEVGLFNLLKQIKSLGLRIGIWFEMEVCGEAAKIYSKPDSWFVTRKHGRIGTRERKFFNFSNPDVCAYLTQRIGKLVNMGVELLKNDYNAGYFACGDEEVYGLQKNQEAFFKFIDSLYKKYPGLIIENCGSGAMREDGNTLSHFAMQSISDQVDAYQYPSIIKGSLFNVLPEQLGIWAMPNPISIDEKPLKSSLDLADGEHTIFNMVNGLAGIMYLSGRIDFCDEYNLSLIREAVSVAKEIYPFVRNSYPQYPLGLKRSENKTYDALILSNESDSEKLLYVWRLQGPSVISLPIGTGYEIELLYPKSKSVEYQQEKGILKIVLPKENSARLFRIIKR